MTNRVQIEALENVEEPHTCAVRILFLRPDGTGHYWQQDYPSRDEAIAAATDMQDIMRQAHA